MYIHIYTSVRSDQLISHRRNEFIPPKAKRLKFFKGEAFLFPVALMLQTIIPQTTLIFPFLTQ